jgi:uncharacterized protein YecT (DUF1311 family)
MLAQVSTAKADDCQSPQTQASMNECANAAYKTSDAELNAVYKELKERLKGDADKSNLLTTAQRAWIAYRDGECKLSASGVSGGSIYPSVYAGCLDRLTKQRISDLKVYAACREGDLSCPVPAK